MTRWLRLERTRRWLDPLALVLAIACLGVVAFVVGTDDAFVPILLVPVAGVLVTAFVRSNCTGRIWRLLGEEVELPEGSGDGPH